MVEDGVRLFSSDGETAEDSEAEAEDMDGLIDYKLFKKIVKSMVPQSRQQLWLVS